MKIKIHKAQQTLKATPIEDLFIDASETMPSFPQLHQAAYAYQMDAVLLANALFDSLPGGTMDCLIADLFKRRASMLVVTFEDKQESK